MAVPPKVKEITTGWAAAYDYPALSAVVDYLLVMAYDYHWVNSDPVPIAFARGPEIHGTHVIVSDCRWLGRVPATDSRTIWVRPRMAHTGTLWSPRRGLVAAVRTGEAAVTDQVLSRIHGWFEEGAPAREIRAAL